VFFVTRLIQLHCGPRCLFALGLVECEGEHYLSALLCSVWKCEGPYEKLITCRRSHRQDRVVGIGRGNKLDDMAAEANNFFSTRPYWVWCLLSHLFNGYCRSFPGVRRPELQVNHSQLLQSLRMSGAIFLFPLYVFMEWSVTTFNLSFYQLLRQAVAQFVNVLCHKPEGRGFDSRWCHWNFSLT
jgi:hypothetical protein